MIGESNIMAAQNPVRVLVWDEAPRHAPKELYPASINGAIAAALNEQGAGQIVAETANLDEANQGITAEKLKDYDVLLWWGHARHGEVTDEVAAIVKQAVHEDGLGFIPLHSGHYSKPFKAVLEATGDLKGGWREIEGFEPEEVTVCAPRHPIAQGVEDFEDVACFDALWIGDGINECGDVSSFEVVLGEVSTERDTTIWGNGGDVRR